MTYFTSLNYTNYTLVTGMSHHFDGEIIFEMFDRLVRRRERDR